MLNIWYSHITMQPLFFFFLMQTLFVPMQNTWWCVLKPHVPLPKLLILFFYLFLYSCSVSLPFLRDGMCSGVSLLFPIFASQRGDFGIAAEQRCHGSWLCFRTVYTWDLESLSVVYLSPIYSTFLLGFLCVARAISAPLPFFSSAVDWIQVTYVMRHIK